MCNSRRDRPRLERSVSLIRDGLGGLRFLRSFCDLRIICQKVAYLLPRAIGALDRFTTMPPSLQIEPTNNGNARCICCSTARSSRPRGYMDFDLFRRIIDDAAQVGVKRVHLFLHGEPVLHPRIVEMISYIESRDLAIHLVTNGALLDTEKAGAILLSGISSADHITFSILGCSNAVHEKIMRNLNHDEVVVNITGSMESRTELGVNGPVIETAFCTMPENEHEKEQYFKYWHGKVDHTRLGGRTSESFAKREGTSITPRKQTCKDLWKRMTVFWNGDVTLCSEDVDGDFLFGNLMDNSMTEIWNYEQLLYVKRIHRRRRFQELPFCVRCDR